MKHALEYLFYQGMDEHPPIGNNLNFPQGPCPSMGDYDVSI